MAESEQPPESTDPLISKPSYKLFSPKQVFGATFFGGPLAGGWLLRRNYVFTNKKSEGRTALIWSLISSVAIICLCWFLPDRVPKFLLSLTYSWGFYVLAQRWQGQLFRDHLRAKGERESNGQVAIIVLCAVLVFLSLIAIASMLF